jgi:uncharacterized protein YraI
MGSRGFIRRAAAVVLLVAMPAVVIAAITSGAILKSTELRTKPYLDAPKVTTLAAGAPVGIVERKGGWLRVKSGTRTGWVRMLYVRTGTAGAGTSASVIGKGTVQLATGRAGSGNVVATSGIRGLDEEQLAKAESNPAQLAKLKTLAANESAARAYAKRVGLKPRTVAALPVPGVAQ